MRVHKSGKRACRRLFRRGVKDDVAGATGLEPVLRDKLGVLSMFCSWAVSMDSHR